MSLDAIINNCKRIIIDLLIILSDTPSERHTPTRQCTKIAYTVRRPTYYKKKEFIIILLMLNTQYYYYRL